MNTSCKVSMFGRLTRKMMKNRNFSKVISFLKYNFLLEDISYSQNCEDIIIDRLLDKDEGLYVDIGAHHPYKYSNTYRLYLRGWRGINVDPLPDCMRLFEQYRPKDINLNIGISSEEGQVDYFSFKEPAYNTINEERACKIIKNCVSELERKIVISTRPLKMIFDSYLGEREIDVLNIDVETMEMEVLMSNDWKKYKPKLIVMESIVSCNESVDRLKDDCAIRFLIEKNYIVIAKCMNAVFLALNDKDD